MARARCVQRHFPKSNTVPDKQGSKKKSTTIRGRDERGRILPGYTGNPNGRPKGIECLGPIMRNMMPQPCTLRIPKTNKLMYPGKTWGEALAESTLENAVMGNAAALHEVWERVDGKVALPIEATGDLTIVIADKYKPNIKDRK